MIATIFSITCCLHLNARYQFHKGIHKKTLCIHILHTCVYNFIDQRFLFSGLVQRWTNHRITFNTPSHESSGQRPWVLQVIRLCELFHLKLYWTQQSQVLARSILCSCCRGQEWRRNTIQISTANNDNGTKNGEDDMNNFRAVTSAIKNLLDVHFLVYTYLWLTQMLSEGVLGDEVAIFLRWQFGPCQAGGTSCRSSCDAMWRMEKWCVLR